MENQVVVSNSITFWKKMKYYEVKSVIALFSHEKKEFSSFICNDQKMEYENARLVLLPNL